MHARVSPMSQSEVSLNDLARAFAQMLPGAKDVFLHNPSLAETEALRSESVFALNLVSSTGTMQQTSGKLPITIERHLNTGQLPLPSKLFAGAWLRFDHVPDEKIITYALRLVVPRGLVVIVAPSSTDLEAHLNDISTAADSQAPDVKILGAATIKTISRMQATLLICLKAIHPEPTHPDCTFCLPSRFDVNKQVSLPGASAALWGDEEFLVVPDVAPIERGHLLLVSTKHWFSMGAIPDSSYQFLDRHVTRLERTMRLGFGKEAIFIEHGATRPHEAGSCIDHAHWHCLPDVGAIMDNLARMGMHAVSAPLLAAKELTERKQPYFLVRKDGEHWFFPGTGLPCQFLRLTASYTGSRTNPRWQHVINSRDNRGRYADTLKCALPAADTILREISSGSCQREVLPEETMGA
jgi:diadenosine tetraphosphate (Ap4A) HIT family hydrolase